MLECGVGQPSTWFAVASSMERSMAIRVMPFHAIVLRLFVPQDITQSGWRMLIANVALGRFDGEIMAFGSMDPIAIIGVGKSLEGMGFKGPVHGDDADFALLDRGEGAMPSWLEKVELRFFDSGLVSAAWKMVNSETYALADQNGRESLPTKGYQVDWPPFIGRIGK